jgi:hypothetical protein
LSGKEWLEDHAGEKSRIIERRGISRRLIFAGRIRTGETGWNPNGKKLRMEKEKIGWTALLASIACSSFLFAHSATRSAQGQGETGTHASELSGVWVQKVGQATRPDWFDLQGNRLEKLPLTARGEERFKANRATHGPNSVASLTSTEPIVKCLPPGVPAIYMVSIYPMEIIQVPGRVIMFFEYGNYVRQIFTDGRKHQNLTPTWMGDSVGRWEGDTLIVDASGFNDKTWIDSEGNPHSDALHVVERIRRVDHDHLVDEITVDDPETYTKTLTTKRVFDFEQGWNIAEFVCEDSDVFLNFQKKAGAEKK